MCKIAALNLSPLDTHKYPPEVEWSIDQNNLESFLELSKNINADTKVSGVIIQHEYGIFGGPDGAHLVSFMENCKKPMIVTLHTILPEPSLHLKEVTQSIIKLARAVIVLTNNSKSIIEDLYPESRGKVHAIPHGIHEVSESDQKEYKKKLKLEKHTVLTTFGLLSSGKGIEYVLQALPPVIKAHPEVIYLVLGETHPVVRRQEGETYRSKLAQLVIKLNLQNHVRFYDQYFNLTDLFEFLKATDIYIATSTDPNQAVSGTLSYALGTGRAVISTDFAQAKEIITSKNGRLIPIKNSEALTQAIFSLMTDQKLLKVMQKNAYKTTRNMLWNTVAGKYIDVLQKPILPPLNISHLIAMTDDFGLFQFANHSTPDTKHGYTLDDNARALIVCSWILKTTKNKKVMQLLKIYLAFIKTCQLENGEYINYLAHKDKNPTLQNTHEDIEDSHARAQLALAEVISNNKLPEKVRKDAQRIFLKYMHSDTLLAHMRAKAFMIKAFSLALPFLKDEEEKLRSVIDEYAASLTQNLQKNSVKSWRWFEDKLNYNNAILPESLIIAGKTLHNKKYFHDGILTLNFLLDKTFSQNMYLPIGHNKWYKNNEERSSFDQQPEDPASTILALYTAFTYTTNLEYKKKLVTCFSWFMGNNSLGKSLYDYATGGCYDGLHPDRINQNQGAESLVSFLMARMITSTITDEN